jgi:hypothetical protein
MLLEYRMWHGSLRWMWWCPSCRHVILSDRDGDE